MPAKAEARQHLLECCLGHFGTTASGGLSTKVLCQGLQRVADFFKIRICAGRSTAELTISALTLFGLTFGTAWHSKTGKPKGSPRQMNDMDSKRRNFLKSSAALTSVAALVGAPVNGRAAQDGMQVRVAGYDYDRVKGIINGLTGIDGATVSFHYEDIYAVNRLAFGPEKTYEVTEIGLIPYIKKFVNEGFRDYTLIPVPISRIFRHRNVFVHTESGIDNPKDLKGRRVGTPTFGASANTWIRGFLKDEYGVEARDMQWIETTESSDNADLQGAGSGGNSFNEDGSFANYLPSDFPLVQGPSGVDESELLLSRQCDALITAITPKAFLEGNPKIKRLFPNVQRTEQEYFEKTRLFPIMHIVAVRKSTIAENPEMPMAIFQMYSKAKELAYSDLETTTSLKISLPWVTQEFENTRTLMGKDYWGYGISANHQEFEHVMRYAYEQGLLKHQIDYRQMFDPSTLET